MEKSPKKRESAPSPKERWWKQPWGWAKFAGPVVLGLVTLFVLVPHLSPQRSFESDPNNPYSQAFDVVNSGYLPATDLSAECKLNTVIGDGVSADLDNHITDGSVGYSHFAKKASYGIPITLPCDRMARIHGYKFKDSTLAITVNYYIAGTPIPRTQTFNYRLQPQSDGLHWRAE